MTGRWPLHVGMGVAGAAAVVASASTLADLARAAGWAGWTPWLLPAALDVGGAAAGWCWLRTGAAWPARRYGRTVALAGATGTLVGNGAGHLTATGYLNPGPVLVVMVGAVPAAVLIALAHLAALLSADDTQPTGLPVGVVADREPVPPVEPHPPQGLPAGPGTDAAPDGPGPVPDRLVLAGRVVAADLGRTGRPLTRTALTTGLRDRGHPIGTAKATVLLAQLRETA